MYLYVENGEYSFSESDINIALTELEAWNVYLVQCCREHIRQSRRQTLPWSLERSAPGQVRQHLKHIL